MNNILDLINDLSKYDLSKYNKGVQQPYVYGYNVYELENGEFKIEVNCTGCKKDNLKVKMMENSVIISNTPDGSKKEGTPNFVTFDYDQKFEFKIDFDEKIEKSSKHKNSLQNGILTVYVQIPQKEEKEFEEIDFE